ncbi:MAG: TrkH family potassium uptake protein [Hyphomicrobiales bacterium]|nr:TrkH family potassium uptake protein [Hyphomicrobiales bacterium]
MTAIIFYLASMGAILSVAMAIPVLIAFGLQEFDTGIKMFIHVAAWGFLSIGVLLSIIGRNRALSRLGAFYLCLVTWTLFPAIIAIAIMDLLSVSYIEALFEVLSAFTTNGASIIGNPDVVPKSVISFLAVLQWLGGLATLITVSIVLAPSGIGGLREELHNTFGKSLVASPARLHEFCLKLLQIFTTLTAFCFSALLLAGVAPFDGFILSMTALSSGGILPGKDSIESTLGLTGMVIIAIFLLIGATSIYWHKMVVLWRKEYLVRHRESYYFIVLWIILAMTFSSVIYSASGSSSNSTHIDALSEGLFNSASLISTSGLQSRQGVFPLLPPILVLALLFFGGCGFSTSGGLKLYRIGGMLSQSLYELNRLIFPNIIRPTHFGSHIYDLKLMKAMWSFFASAVVVIFLGAVLLAACDLNFQAAFTASIANFTTAGPAYGPEWSIGSTQGWPEYFEMSIAAQLVLIFLMLAGRLELIALLALLNFSYWNRR